MDVVHLDNEKVGVGGEGGLVLSTRRDYGLKRKKSTKQDSQLGL